MAKRRSKAKAVRVSIKKILVPLDFSECSSNALGEAIFIAKTFSAKIELVHVITPVYIASNSSELHVPYDTINYERMLLKAEKNLASMAKQIEKREIIKVGVKAILNTPYIGILEHAKKTKADLIIMGTHGTSGVKEFFAGSNAYRVVSESLCPVITVQNRITKKGFRSIVLPIRSEINSRQKVNLVAVLAKAFLSTVHITGYTKNGNKNERFKVKQYVKQVEELFIKESINFESSFIDDDNFTKSIIRHAKTVKADLIAVMTSHDFSLDQLLSGPYAQQFVNHSKLPVLSVPNTLDFEYSFENPLSGGFGV